MLDLEKILLLIDGPFNFKKEDGGVFFSGSKFCCCRLVLLQNVLTTFPIKSNNSFYA